MFDKIVTFIQEIYNTKDFIPLHEPRFLGNEKKYLNECIDSTFVSSVGKFVDLFEQKVTEYVGAEYAVATVNGTCALHAALVVAGVQKNDEVLTQSLSFVATANAISYTGAMPIFIDVSLQTLGMCPDSLEEFLQKNTELREDGFSYNINTNRKIKACVPMHTFGHPTRIDEIKRICSEYKIIVAEDSAESLGSLYKGSHTGTFGSLGVYSFNGNKTMTTGGGGVIVTDDEELAKKAKHLTTTAKVPHKWEYVHDQVGFNYRMPNLNAALGCAQLEQLADFIEKKRILSLEYKTLFKMLGVKFIDEPSNAKSNFWLNAILLENIKERNQFLEYTNSNGVMTRPIWCLLNKLPMFENSQSTDLKNSLFLEQRIVNLPSSVLI